MTFLLFDLGLLIGSIPTGVILAKAFDVDPRTQGSGNIGATNIYRTAGKKLGVITLLGDILKGLIPVVIARGVLESHLWIGAVALAAFLGHLYPIFLKFKEERGLPRVWVLFWPWRPFRQSYLFWFLAVVYKWRYISLGP